MTTELRLKLIAVGSKINDTNKELLELLLEVGAEEGEKLLSCSQRLLDAQIQINKAAQQ